MIEWRPQRKKMSKWSICIIKHNGYNHVFFPNNFEQSLTMKFLNCTHVLSYVCLHMQKQKQNPTLKQICCKQRVVLASDFLSFSTRITEEFPHSDLILKFKSSYSAERMFEYKIVFIDEVWGQWLYFLISSDWYRKTVKL